MYSRRRHRHNLDSVTIGRYAGEESYTENTVSIGRKAGYLQQKQWAIAIGDRAGEETQDLNAIAIGVSAGQSSQSTFAIAIGDQAGRTSQGASAIAIGKNAGSSNQPAYSIIISSSDTEITAAKKGLYIDPIRNFDDRDSIALNGNILVHLHETKEVVTGLPKLPGYSADPTTSEVGSLYYDTAIKRVKVYKEGKWVALLDEDDLEPGSKLMDAIKKAADDAAKAAVEAAKPKTP
jgi:hypothetical protein